MSGDVRLCALDELEQATARKFEVADRVLAVVRLDDDVFIIGDRCSHADVSLSEGEVDRGDKTIECWRHGASFSLEDGTPQSLPAVKPVPTYVARVTDGEVFVAIESKDQAPSAVSNERFPNE